MAPAVFGNGIAIPALADAALNTSFAADRLGLVRKIGPGGANVSSDTVPHTLFRGYSPVLPSHQCQRDLRDVCFSVIFVIYTT
jgi:hypothetical protein